MHGEYERRFVKLITADVIRRFMRKQCHVNEYAQTHAELEEDLSNKRYR